MFFKFSTKYVLPYILLLIISIFLFYPYFDVRVVPEGDSMEHYQVFSYFIRETRTTASLPMWLPYSGMGKPFTLHQLVDIGPAQYLTGLIAILVGAKDAMTWFKFSMLLNVLIYVSCVWLFAREVLGSLWVAFILGLGALLTLSWFHQLHFNFYAFYLLPLVFYMLVRWSKTEDIRFLYFAALIECCSIIGGCTYVYMLHPLIFICVLAGLFFDHSTLFRSLFKVSNLYYWQLHLLIAVGSFLAFFAFSITDDAIFLGAGRDSQTFKVPLESFLNHGRFTPGTSLYGLVSGGLEHSANSYYVGLLTFALVIWGSLRLRSGLFFGLLTASTLLMFMSVGGKLAEVLYHFPGMSMYRHIGAVFGISGALLLMAAAIAADRLLVTDAEPKHQTFPRWRNPLIMVLLGGLVADAVFSLRPGDEMIVLPHIAMEWWQPVLRMLAYGAAALTAIWFLRPEHDGTRSRTIICTVFALSFVLDVGLFQWRVLHHLPRVEEPPASGTFDLRPMTWKDERQNDISDPHALQHLSVDIHPSWNYDFLYSYLGVDLCRPLVRAQMLSRGVHSAINAMGGKVSSVPSPDSLPQEPSRRRALGCEFPKVTFAGDFLWAESTEGAVDLLGNAKDPDVRPILSPGAMHQPALSGPFTSQAFYEVMDFGSNHLSLDVEVRDTLPALMIYADGFASGWRAQVNGQETPVFRANVGYKGIVIPPGRQRVEFRYGSPIDLAKSWGMAILGLLFIAVLIIVILRGNFSRQSGAG